MIPISSLSSPLPKVIMLKFKKQTLGEIFSNFQDVTANLVSLKGRVVNIG